MKRRELLKSAAAFGCMATIPFSTVGDFALSSGRASEPKDVKNPTTTPTALKPPASGTIPVAFLLSKGAVVIDFTGPWEVFHEVMIPGRMEHPFHVYTVAETAAPIRASGGLKIVPDYGLAEGNPADLVVFDAPTEADALRLVAPRHLVLRAGRVVARTVPAQTSVVWHGTEEPVTFLRPPA